MVLGNLNKIYNVGLYIRLSREDDDKTLESESITNQKSLLLQYVKENNLMVYDIYIDDGYSGTNFDRPDFNRLLNDIESGKINMVITKDMSRLGRDYIGTGNLIEKYFPEHNVRYIAVTDNIDTFLDSSNNDIAPFKAIMNDMYAKDISKKIKSSLKAKMKEGKWVGGRTPFGYDQDKENKNHLVINTEQASVVKRIFDMCLEGLSFFKIAKQLTNEGVKTPVQYYNFEWKNNYNLKYGEWHSKTIRDILTNRMYIGDMIQNRRSKVNYKVKKVIKNSPNDYIVVENTHEAIIDKDIFYEVQERIPKNVGRNEKKEIHLLDGLLYCGDCGNRISIQSRRKRDNRCYTICNYYRTYMKQKFCTTHSNNYDELEKKIINSLTAMCLNCINKDKIKNSILSDLSEDSKINDKKELETVINDMKQINDNLDIVYIDKLNKKITEEQFERVKTKLENELTIKQKRYNELNKMNETINEESKNKMIIEYINKFLSMKEPSRELIISLIDKIEIFEDKTINIKVSFS
ncbi:MAG: recombinase family protein [Bacilli bacterium]|nr:recombinase family protein [Bacilli bacterium]